ncbi:MAG: hypothetical protein KDB01_01645 [Planctomycetaceae bacterium]|nr:hypothetical protein [Planctomycetaceae bacterium]
MDEATSPRLRRTRRLVHYDGYGKIMSAASRCGFDFAPVVDMLFFYV